MSLIFRHAQTYRFRIFCLVVVSNLSFKASAAFLYSKMLQLSSRQAVILQSSKFHSLVDRKAIHFLRGFL